MAMNFFRGKRKRKMDPVLDGPGTLVLPRHWAPEWTGSCPHCECEQVRLTAQFDEHFNLVAYDLWVQCSWCHRDYSLPTPTMGVS